MTVPGRARQSSANHSRAPLGAAIGRGLRAPVLEVFSISNFMTPSYRPAQTGPLQEMCVRRLWQDARELRLVVEQTQEGPRQSFGVESKVTEK